MAYGAEVARAVASLFREHIALAVPVLVAAKKGDKAALASAVADWRKNAHKIAAATSNLDPSHFPLQAVEKEMNEHLDQTIAYASAVIAKDYAGTNAAFDKARQHMAHFADVVAAGISAKMACVAAAGHHVSTAPR